MARKKLKSPNWKANEHNQIYYIPNVVTSEASIIVSEGLNNILGILTLKKKPHHIVLCALLGNLAK